MATECKHDHPLQHDGLSQQQRFLDALEPANAPVHEFDLRDWMRFAWHYAARLGFFSVTDDLKPQGNWQDFMKSEDELEAWLKDAALVEHETWISPEERAIIMRRELRQDYEPHLALFLSFLKLLRYPQEHLNGFTRRHLDFYYTRVLGLARQPAVPDRVHLLFELAGNAASQSVPAGMVLDAGKDANGKPLRYAVERETTVSRASVALLRSVYHKKGSIIRYAEMTDSSDGLGTAFTTETPSSWNAFGNEGWPAASVGFALASGALLLKEGRRMVTVSLTLKFPAEPAFPEPEKVAELLRVFLSGQKEWMAPSTLTVSRVPAQVEDSLEFSVLLDPSQKAVVPYQSDLHGERFCTNLPVLRVLVDTGSTEGYGLYRLLANSTLIGATIDVDVSGVKELVVENDLGGLDSSKPFYPFGPVPGIGSSFWLGCAEVFQKRWSAITLMIDWKDKPESLVDHYAAYKRSGLAGSAIFSSEASFTVQAEYLSNNRWYQGSADGKPVTLFSTDSADVKGDVCGEANSERNRRCIEIVRHEDDEPVSLSSSIPSLLMKKGVDVNKALLRSYLDSSTDDSSAVNQRAVPARFESARFNPGFTAPSTTAKPFSATSGSGFVRLSLKQDFLHDRYAQVLMLTMIDKMKSTPLFPDVELPNQPYAPVIATMSIGYRASASNTFEFPDSATPKEKYENFTARSIQFFHEHPFGQSEQHVFLKEQCDFIDPSARRRFSPLPAYHPEGEFYIGLKDAQPSGRLSLLVQALEGSEEPLAPSFGLNEEIQWHALSNNEWKSLNESFINADDTNRMLRAGIVEFNLPALVNDSNTVLDAGYFWLRASLPTGLVHTSVCRLTGLFAQAARAVFTDKGNDRSPFASALPAGTIGKIIDKPPFVKAVSQPFASFGGAAPEDDRAFCLRVSERLRHKQRAVNIRDYELLVLQQFPSVHKVKCMSHSSMEREAGSSTCPELAPGHVALVVIADLRNKAAFDPLQPRASRDLLDRIEAFLRPLTSLHVRFKAGNPDYETVLFDFRVKFCDNVDPTLYRKVLNDDIVRYLSPWAFSDFSDIHFGGRVFKSRIIRFIEQRSYVDFISQVKMYHRITGEDMNQNDLHEIVASSARAILVSAALHTIELIEKDRVCHE
ncbi:MAG: hypothetical protein HGA97_00795 [Chlorobiaceae bacterium]|nr:hypothetical protein [Chlorobiaceae bacterium]